jgi:tetratricopeptide (TPR) repeat protein
MMVGCLLLLAPCLFSMAGVVIFGWPFVLSFLSQGFHLVGPAQPGEALVLVAGLEGTSGLDPTDRIAQTLQDGIRNAVYQIGSSTHLRVGRLGDIPLSEEDARQLGQHYNASIVIWGKYDATNSYQVTCSILQPVDALEPEQFTLVLTQGDKAALEDLSTLALAIAVYHNGDAYSASTLLGTLGSNLDPGVTTSYRYVVLRAIGDPASAQAVIDMALSGDPQNGHLLGLKASALLDQFQYEEALKAVSLSIEQEPDQAEVYLLRGTIYQKMGSTQNALDDYAYVLDLVPNHTGALRARAQMYQALDDIQAALADYGTLIELEPENYHNFLERAQLYVSHDDRSEALDDFAQALAKAKEADASGYYSAAQIQVLTARARTLREFGRYDEALDDYEQLMNIAPSNGDYLLEQGMAYWEMGDQAAARLQWEAYMQFVGLAQDAPGYNNLAWSLAMLEYYEPALEYSNQSLALDPSNPDSLHTRGYIHLGLKEYQAALDDFERALNNNLSYVPVYRDMADAYAGLEQYEQAIQSYETYLNLAPAPEDRYAVEKRLAAAQAALNP